MAELLALPDPPDAVFCFNDLLAVGTLRAAADHGYQVPQDIAIAGFDNSEQSAYSVPSLTTIAPDEIALARSAVDLIHTRSGDRDGFTPQDVQIPFPSRFEKHRLTDSNPQRTRSHGVQIPQRRNGFAIGNGHRGRRPALRRGGVGVPSDGAHPSATRPRMPRASAGPSLPRGRTGVRCGRCWDG